MIASRRLRSLLLVAAAVLVGAAGAQGPVAGTLRVAFPVAENGFDPQAIYDAYSARVCNAIFDPLYTYDYFARPARLVPNTADGLPLIGDGGRTYTIKVRRGIHFAPHPAFGNAKRELTAEDYVYSIKRILDPQVRSYSLYLLENRLVGLDPVLAEARRTGRLDYAAPIEGLKALDRYTLQVKFREPNWSFQHLLTTTAFAAVAREVVAAKGDSTGRVMEDPVGTGPYRLAEWRRSQRIVLESNPAFRDVRFPTPPPAMRRTPRSPRVSPVASCRCRHGSRSRSSRRRSPGCWRFAAASSTTSTCPRRSPRRSSTARNLKPDLAKAGVRLHRQVDAVARLHVLQHGGPGRRRLRAGEDRIAARDHDGQRPPRVRARPCQRPGRTRHADDPPAGARALARARASRTRSTPPRRARCSTASATATATATAFARRPTASRCCCARARHRSPPTGRRASCGRGTSRRSGCAPSSWCRSGRS